MAQSVGDGWLTAQFGFYGLEEERVGPVWASFPSLYKTRVRILVYFGAAKVLCFTFSPSYAALIIETKDDCKTFTTPSVKSDVKSGQHKREKK